MEVVTIESKAFKQLMEKLDALSEYVHSMDRPEKEDENEAWVDSGEVCRFLKISERTLQRLRSDGKITYSCLGGKYYYQISEIKKLLRGHIIKSKDEYLDEMLKYNKKR